MFLGNWAQILNLTNKHLLQILFRYGFRETLIQQTEDAIFFNNYPVGLNFSNTLKYWVVKNNLNFVLGEPINRLELEKSENIIYNKYHCFAPLLLTRATSRLFKKVFIKFLSFLTLTWSQWNRSVSIYAQHSMLFKSLYFLRFLNVYYCKVFNF